jgi:hypothetical protein
LAVSRFEKTKEANFLAVSPIVFPIDKREQAPARYAMIQSQERH